MKKIDFNIPYTSIRSLANVQKLIDNPGLVGQLEFTDKCEQWFEERYPEHKAIMTTSCTRSLELAALAMGLNADDEVIMPAFNFVGVSNAFANYNANLVFVDILPDTMHMDPDLVERAITKKTKALVVMHYNGMGSHIETLSALCQQHGIALIEDNAQGIQTRYNSQLLGSFGDFSCISFDKLKNVSCSQGGVLLCKNEWFDKVAVPFEIGTNRYLFNKGHIDAYEWTSRGSNFAMSQYIAAVLLPLLEESETINADRRAIWNNLYDVLYEEGSLRNFLPHSFRNEVHNGHIFFLKMDDKYHRDAVINYLHSHAIGCAFHYTPLHTSKAGKGYRFVSGEQDVTVRESDRLLRLPMHNHLKTEDVEYIRDILVKAINQIKVHP